MWSSTSHFTLHTSHFTLHTALFALHTSHFTLHSSHSKLHAPHFTLLTSHFSLHTSHSTLHTPHFTLHASHFSLLSSDSTLHTSHFTRHSPHFTLLIAFFTLHTSSLHREAFTHSKLSHTASIYTQNTYTQCFYTWQALTHTHRNFYTETLLHTEKLLHTANFYTQNFYTQQAFTHSKRLHTVLAHSAFTHGKRLHTEHLHTVLLHMASVYTHRNFYTGTLVTHAQISFYTQQTFTHNIFYTQQAFTHSKRLDTEHLHTVLAHSAFTHTNFYTQALQLQNRISTPKRQKDDFEALFKRNFKRKIISAKIEKICWQFTFAALMQPFQYDLRSSAAKDNSITHAAAAPSNLDAPTTMNLQRLSWKAQKNCPQRCRKLQLQNRISTPKRQKDDFEALFKRNFKRKIISAKIEKICWQFTFAALMQPFQYDLRSSAAKDNSITHAAVAPSNLDAATTMRFAASRGKPTPIYARGNTKWQQSCSHSNAICNHSSKNRIELRTQEQPLVAKHIGGTICDRNDPSRTRRTDEVPFIAGCSHFTRKNTRFRAPASSPKHNPCNIHAAIPMRSCNQRFQNRIELRTQEQPLVAKHIGGTIRAWNDPSRTRRTDEVPFIAGCSHFTRKNTRFRAPASSPKHSPCNIHAAIPMRSCNQRFRNRIELRTQEQPLVAKHIGGTIRDRNDPRRTRRTDEVPFIAGCSHFTR